MYLLYVSASACHVRLMGQHRSAALLACICGWCHDGVLHGQSNLHRRTAGP